MELFDFYQNELIKVAKEISELEITLDKVRNVSCDHEDNIKILKMYKNKEYFTKPSQDIDEETLIFCIDDRAIVVKRIDLATIVESVDKEEKDYIESILRKRIQLIGLEAKAAYLVEQLSILDSSN